VKCDEFLIIFTWYHYFFFFTSLTSIWYRAREREKSHIILELFSLHEPTPLFNNGVIRFNYLLFILECSLNSQQALNLLRFLLIFSYFIFSFHSFVLFFDQFCIFTYISTSHVSLFIQTIWVVFELNLVWAWWWWFYLLFLASSWALEFCNCCQIRNGSKQKKFKLRKQWKSFFSSSTQ
jgi:hypothetical protein